MHVDTTDMAWIPEDGAAGNIGFRCAASALEKEAQ